MKALSVGLLLALAALPVQAHTPYLHAKGEIGQNGGLVSLEASFAEKFFIPEAAFDQSEFRLTAPDGKQLAPDRVEVWKARTLAEHRLDATPGTWRFSTGKRYGALFRTWEINGKRESSRDLAVKIPEGAKIISNFQSVTLAETYLTVGAPNRTALAARGEGLEIVAIDHPTDLYVGEPFRFTVLFDGKPLAGQKVEITEAVSDTGNTPQVVTLTTDAEGQASFRSERATRWLALTRHRTPAPPSSGVAEYSHSYTLTFRTLAQ
ncbi:cobalt ABC transporter substrate-binding protein [Lysobacteraceae bacterium NML120232]|nr:cobalt ABC transporter substrate-binding protein [Xanthomonadaceae bacterium NML08-0793]PJK13126.1 cobalt ABC transporter substrate-binding protein [Xanthomonadaceae bacterium NML120232]